MGAANAKGKKLNIFLVHTGLRTFVQIDIELLQSAHNVRALHMRRSQPLHVMLDLWCLIRGVIWADVVLAWFGSYQAFLAFLPALLLRRKRIIIASGYDVANEPALDYGGLRGGIRRWMGLKSFCWADKVLPVSHFSAQQAMQNARVPAEKIHVAYHGVDANQFQPLTEIGIDRKDVLTISTVNDQTVRIKGIDLFIEVAKALPSMSFTIVGPWEGQAIEILRAGAPPNVDFAGPKYKADLVRCMNSTQIYAQLSAYESFGMAVAEAMLCGCVPVVTDRGALPEVVGDLGFVVPYGDIGATVQAIRHALTVSDDQRQTYRRRIIEHFSLEARRKQLLDAVEEL